MSNVMECRCGTSTPPHLIKRLDALFQNKNLPERLLALGDCLFKGPGVLQEAGPPIPPSRGRKAARQERNLPMLLSGEPGPTCPCPFFPPFWPNFFSSRAGQLLEDSLVWGKLSAFRQSQDAQFASSKNFLIHFLKSHKNSKILVSSLPPI